MKLIQDMTEVELGSLMNALGHSILDTAKAEGVERPHFVLLLFNDPKVSQYVSNCRREDIVLALQEGADRLKRKEDVER